MVIAATAVGDRSRDDPRSDHNSAQANFDHFAAWRPDDLDRAMIRISDPFEFDIIELPVRPPSLGALGKFPPEILHVILNFLDLQSMSRISRVSASGLSLVQSLPAYRELTQYSPMAITALAESRLLTLHPISQLRRALWSSQCECCPEYGAFLFLPTCVRCCWECLRVSPSLRAIPLGEVKRYFGLKEQHVATLPMLHTIPGQYAFSDSNQHLRTPRRIVSAAAARELALAVHGSAERLSENLRRRLKTPRSLVIGRFLQATATSSPGIDPLARPWEGNVPPDDYFGMATLPFPSLQRRSGDVEHGVWCRGCHYLFQNYRQLDSAVIDSVVPPKCSTDRVLHGLTRRARSKSMFLEHARRCYGVQRIDPERARH